jgi:uncharacterized protein (DUF58 family)
MIKSKPQRLNLDIAGSIAELQAMMEEFRLRRDIYKILFRGKGLEFESFRDFSPDDDASDIDWKSSSRAQKLLVKQYREERDLKIVFCVDVGSNMILGSGKKLKCEFVAELAVSFANLVIGANDRIGFLLFSEKINNYIDCKGGTKQLELFIDLLSDSKNYGGKSTIDGALDFVLTYLDSSINSIIFISDFLNVSEETEKKFELLNSRFETILIRVRDILDITLPDVHGEVILEDPSSHEQIVLNPKVAKKTYEAYAFQQAAVVEEMFKKSGSDYLDLITNKSFAIPLAIFLKDRLEKKT